MKIVHIVPGTGGTFYCQNCLRDMALIGALRRRGHDVLVVPMYLPVRLDETELSTDTPIFFGGINVYLQQKFGLFRHTPRWLDHVLDARWILRRAAKREGSTDPASLGDMTLSMLRGRHGHQGKELDRLTAWLAEHEQPDVVHLSNSLLIGLAQALRERLGVPICCTLQDEDTWLDAMEPKYSRLCWDAMAARDPDVAAYIVVSDWYARQMHDRMGVADDRLHRVHIGLDLSAFEAAMLPFEPPVIGYLSRLGKAQGLEQLVDAFITIKAHPQLKQVKLRATGGITALDRAFVAHLREKLRAAGILEDVEFLEHFGDADRRAFLQSVSVLSVPVPEGEAFGTYIIEALASGVPVVEPNVGAFPELVKATGGGRIYDQANPAGLAEALTALLLDPEGATALGARGREAVLERFTADAMAERVEKVYASVVSA